MRDRCNPRHLTRPIVALCLLTVAAGTVSAEGVSPIVTTLDNGLKLILVERHEQPTVAAAVFYDVGSVNDPAGQSGIAHLFEHMLFKGTRIIGTSDYAAEKPYIEKIDALRERMNTEMNRMREMKRRGEITDVLDPNQWTDAYKEMKQQEEELLAGERQYINNNELANFYTSNGGAGLNAGTAEDITFYFVQLPSNKLELFFWIESDRMVNGVMREFYVERDNVREERRLRTESTPTGRFDEAFEAMFWQSHPYGIPVVGWASEVESITTDDVRDFYKIHYAPNNAVMVLVGDFESAKAIRMAREYFGRIPQGKVEPPVVVTEEPKPIAERRFYAEAETNPIVRIRYHGVAIGHVDEPAIEVAAELLSGRSGRLYKRLFVDEEAVIGQPSASQQARKYAGYVEIQATIKEGRTPEEVESLILDEVDKLATGEITDYELQKVKNQVLASSIRRLENNLFLMIQLGLYDTWYKWQYINELPKKMLEVTADDVHRVVKNYFDPKTRTVAIYRTKGGAAPGDPELDAVLQDLPPEAQAQVRGMVQQIDALPKAMIEQQIQAIEAALGSGQIPDEQQKVFDYVLKKLKARLQSINAEDAEENHDEE